MSHILHPQDILVTRLQHNGTLPIVYSTTNPLPSGHSDTRNIRAHISPPKFHPIKPNSSPRQQEYCGSMAVRGHFQHGSSTIATNPPIATYDSVTYTCANTEGADNTTTHHNITSRPVPCTKSDFGQQLYYFNKPRSRDKSTTPKGATCHPTWHWNCATCPSPIWWKPHTCPTGEKIQHKGQTFKG